MSEETRDALIYLPDDEGRWSERWVVVRVLRCYDVELYTTSRGRCEKLGRFQRLATVEMVSDGSIWQIDRSRIVGLEEPEEGEWNSD